MADTKKPPLPKTPPPIRLEAEARSTLITAIKTVLAAVIEKGKLPEGTDYAILLNKPMAMHAFISAVKADRSVMADLCVDAKGAAVTDDDSPLSCGLSLNQIERMLVYTVAKRVYIHSKMGKIRYKRFGDPIPEELGPYLAFDWQLPLIESFANDMSPDHFRALGESVLYVRNVSAPKALAQVVPGALRNVLEILDERFPEVLEKYPMAVVGVSRYSRKDVLQIEKIVTSKLVWELFGRDQDALVEVMALDVRTKKAMGIALAWCSQEAVNELSQLDPEFLEPLMQAFMSTFGPKTRLMLGNSEFATTLLREATSFYRDTALMDEKQREQAKDSIELKWGASAQKMEKWLAAQGGDAAAEG